MRPLVDAFAANVFVVGDAAGHGQAAKVLNNIMSAAAIAITAEALVVGARAGLDAKALLDVIAVSSGSNVAVTDKFPKQVLTRRFDHGFRLDLMLKDVRLALDEARAHGVPMVLGATVGELWALGQAAGPEAADCIGDRPHVRDLGRRGDRVSAVRTGIVGAGNMGGRMARQRPRRGRSDRRVRQQLGDARRMRDPRGGLDRER